MLAVYVQTRQLGLHASKVIRGNNQTFQKIIEPPHE
jgi:hypothetical protein